MKILLGFVGFANDSKFTNKSDKVNKKFTNENKKEKISVFYKKLLTNARLDDIIINCLLLACPIYFIINKVGAGERKKHVFFASGLGEPHGEIL